MTMLEAGSKAPDFSLQNQRGETVRLSDFLGKPVVLYFYPKDDTPGCTKEACAFRDQFPAFGELDAAVFGLSPDDVDSHVAFAKKYALPFDLLADADHKVASAFGAWGMKNLYGREFEGIIRSTFIVGPDGVIAKVFPRVRVDGHAEKVIDAVKALSA